MRVQEGAKLMTYERRTTLRSWRVCPKGSGETEYAPVREFNSLGKIASENEGKVVGASEGGICPVTD